jgi:hypothetical protein
MRRYLGNSAITHCLSVMPRLKTPNIVAHWWLTMAAGVVRQLRLGHAKS